MLTLCWVTGWEDCLPLGSLCPQMFLFLCGIFAFDVVLLAGAQYFLGYWNPQKAVPHAHILKCFPLLHLPLLAKINAIHYGIWSRLKLIFVHCERLSFIRLHVDICFPSTIWRCCCFSDICCWYFHEESEGSWGFVLSLLFHSLNLHEHRCYHAQLQRCFLHCLFWILLHTFLLSSEESLIFTIQPFPFPWLWERAAATLATFVLRLTDSTVLCSFFLHRVWKLQISHAPSWGCLLLWEAPKRQSPEKMFTH